MNLAEELEKRGVEVRRHGSKSSEIRVCCPFCVDRHTGADTRFRLGLNLITGESHCFNCDYSSRLGMVTLLQKIGVDPRKEKIVHGFGKLDPQKAKKVRLPLGFEKLENVGLNDPLFGQARRYVRKRGITRRQLREHGIGATVADDFFRYRIVFPVRIDGKLRGLVGRDWTGRSALKYLNSGGEKLVYNLDPERFGNKIAIVSEGITKALAIERALNYKVCSVALLGNQVTDSQADLLKVFSEIALFPDPDVNGMTGFLGVAASLQSKVKKVTMAWPWPKAQADEISPEEIVAAIKGRRPVNVSLRMKVKMAMLKRKKA